MEQRLVKLFKTRWETVEELERRKLQRTTHLEKLYELMQILRIGQELKLFGTDVKDKDLQKSRDRWVRLKRGYK